MDRTALDAAYNNGVAVADAPRFRADWAARSAALRERHPGTLDIAYGAAPRARLDFFRAGPERAPTLAFIHGGYWQMNAKENFAFVAEGPLAHGINVASIGYTLAPEAGMGAIVAEIAAAIDWLARHVGDHGGDKATLYVAGWSAGGHLTATTMSDRRVAGGLAISGVFDLEPIRRSYLNDKLGLDIETARRHSPLHNLPEEAGRLVVTVGGGELPELQRQSRDYSPPGRRTASPPISWRCPAPTISRPSKPWRIPRVGLSRRCASSSPTRPGRRPGRVGGLRAMASGSVIR